MTAADVDCDIAIVGGGLVGAPLALALARAGFSVVLLDQSMTSAPQQDDPLEQRCTALSAGSVAWFEQQALWSAIADDACPIRSVHVSCRGRFGATRLRADEQGVAALGYVIDNRVALRQLDALLDASPVKRLPGHTMTGLDIESDRVTVQHRASDSPQGKPIQGKPIRGKPVRAKLLIGVDGVRSTVRDALGIGVREVDYEQSAILGTLALSGSHENVAYERFTDGGPLALLPRPADRVSVVECVTSEEATRLTALDGTGYRHHLQARFGHRLGRFVDCGPRTTLSLTRIEATEQIGPRSVLLGNAARLLHPVAGQGYNLALRDVAALLTRLVAGVSSGVSPGVANGVANGARIDPGSPELLHEFVRSRRVDQQRTVTLTDTLARTFRGENMLLSHARALALLGLDTVSPWRRRFASVAMGLGGEPGGSVHSGHSSSNG